MMKKRGFWFAASIVVVAIAGAVWYVKQYDAIGRGTPTTIKIGVVLEMTGPLAHYAQSARRGMELASEELSPNLPESAALLPGLLAAGLRAWKASSASFPP